MTTNTEIRRFATQATPEYWRGFWRWMNSGKKIIPIRVGSPEYQDEQRRQNKVFSAAVDYILSHPKAAVHANQTR